MANSIFLFPSGAGSTVSFLGSVSVGGQLLLADGTSVAPSYSFASQPGMGLYRESTNTLSYGIGNATPAMRVAPITTFASGGSVNWTNSSTNAATTIDLTLSRDAANTLAQVNGTNAQAFRLYRTTTGPVYSEINAGLPTISSGFGGTPSVVAGGTAFAFRINVGTGGVATSGVIGMPTMPNGWQAIVQDMTNNTATRVSATTTNTITITAAAAWAANDILVVIAVGF